ncbi:hypothetical protein EAH72_20155 [Pseudomonas caspiana]|uniref:Uncharacterized protein n=1 Tax=Pseudomonas mandelii TaxID=75612 RepID=A0A502HPB1_9PSED|nr:hypothetical protein EAH74_29305 [Pseudomonas mandelii]TPG93710.1 hypothetical protein EAH72_20155 [Pseudomonas caspiana]
MFHTCLRQLETNKPFLPPNFFHYGTAVHNCLFPDSADIYTKRDQRYLKWYYAAH